MIIIMIFVMTVIIAIIVVITFIATVMIIIIIHIIKTETIESHRFKLDLVDKFNLKNPKKKMALANLSIYYT